MQPNRPPRALLIALCLAACGAWIITMSLTVITPGQIGVVASFGAVQDHVLEEGLHFVVPIRDRVIALDTRIQKVEERASASSKDLQIVSSEVALNFYLSKSKANALYQVLGPDYRRTIIEPAIQESVKSATAQYTAEQLITRRNEVKNTISSDLSKRLAKHWIVVTDFSIIDFNFSKEFNRAIEEKQVAEQAALRARNDLTRIETEAQQAYVRAEGEARATVAHARAEADAQRLLRETLSQDILTLKSLERWDGQLPAVLGQTSGGAFYDVVGAIAKAKAPKAR